MLPAGALQRSLTASLVIVGSMGLAFIFLHLSGRFHHRYVERQKTARAEGRPEPEDRLFAEWALGTLSVVAGLLGLCIGILILLPDYVLSIGPSAKTLANYVFALPCIFIALLFYRARRQYPFVYGCVEVLLSVPTLAVSIAKTLEEATLASLLGVIGGIYLLVRGLDNMEKGLPASLRQRWDDIFPSRKS